MSRTSTSAAIRRIVRAAPGLAPSRWFRAIRCATTIGASVRDLGLEVRAGLHTGECEIVGEKLGGLAVNIGARVAARAQAGEVLVTSTVKDLVAGSNITFAERETAELKGVPGAWHLFAVSGLGTSGE